MILAVVLVFVLGSIATLANTRNQLIDDIDQGLTDDLDISMQLFNSFGIDAIGRTRRLRESRRRQQSARHDPRRRSRGPGSSSRRRPVRSSDPFAPPDLSTERIMAGAGEIFTVDGTTADRSTESPWGNSTTGDSSRSPRPSTECATPSNGLSRTLVRHPRRDGDRAGRDHLLPPASELPAVLRTRRHRRIHRRRDMDRRAVQTTSDPDIRVLTTSLNTMLDRLQQAFEQHQRAEDRIKQFAADASHELRTPLTTIAGYSESYLLGAATDPDAVRKQMTRINSEAHRMGRLVNDLLTLARLDQGHGFEAQLVDLQSLVEDAVSDAHADRSLSPGSTLPSSIGPSLVEGDGDALQQVVANLIANTRIHAPDASVEITVDELDDAHAVVTVTDDGPGMTSDVADNVFDRFYRAGPHRLGRTQHRTRTLHRCRHRRRPRGNHRPHHGTRNRIGVHDHAPRRETGCTPEAGTLGPSHRNHVEAHDVNARLVSSRSGLVSRWWRWSGRR
jgi:two-component system, OmpR family, sensor kinase